MITTRAATPADVDAIAGLVNRAYSMYLTRMDREPAPMKDDIAVDPAAHGRGVGNQLLELAVDAARRAGCDRVWLYTHAVMTENVDYERRDFTQYDRRIDAGYDRIYFERRL